MIYSCDWSRVDPPIKDSQVFIDRNCQGTQNLSVDTECFHNSSVCSYCSRGQDCTWTPSNSLE